MNTSTWQPIETVPPNKRCLMLYEREVYTGIFWKTTAGVHDAGRSFELDGLDDVVYLCNGLTHWMPIPDPPTSSKPADEGT